jgi:hypothetical protein
VDRLTDLHDRRPPLQNQSTVEIWELSLLLGVHSDQAQIFPQALDDVIHIQIVLTRYHNSVWLTGEAIDFFKGDLIDFVVAVYTANVFPVSKDDIDKVVDSVVVTDENVGIVNFVALKDLNYPWPL